MYLYEKHIKILTFIAEQGSSTKYAIEKALDMSHGTVYNYVTELNKNQYLQPEKDGLTRTGMTKIWYGLTLRGLVPVLKAYVSDKSWEKIDTLIEKWLHLLPSIFEKWGNFKKEGLKKPLITYFCDIGSSGNDKDVALDSLLHRMDGFLPDKYIMEWYHTLHVEPKLRVMFKERYEKGINDSKRDLVFWMNKKKLVMMLDSEVPDWKEIEKLDEKFVPMRSFLSRSYPMII